MHMQAHTLKKLQSVYVFEMMHHFINAHIYIYDNNIYIIHNFLIIINTYEKLFHSN
jgi:hypothetical protein